MGEPAKRTLGELNDLTTLQANQKVRGPVPSEVTSYDMVTQTCECRPLVAPQGQELPLVSNVPVEWPRGAAGSLTIDLAAGDLVYLVPAEGDISRWYRRGLDGEAATSRRFDLNDSVALPGIGSAAAPLAAAAYAAGAVVLAGADIRLVTSAAADMVALAGKVLTELGVIKSAYDLHVHPETGAQTGVPTVPMTAPSSVASAHVKSD